MNRSVATLATLTTLALGASAAAAPAPAAAASCPSFQVGSTTYGSTVSKVSCGKARSWSKAMVRGKGGPRGWSCVRDITAGTGKCVKGRRGFAYRPLATPASHAKGNWA